MCPWECFQKPWCFDPAEAKAVRGEEGRHVSRLLAGQGERACQGIFRNLNLVTRADNGSCSSYSTWETNVTNT